MFIFTLSVQEVALKMKQTTKMDFCIVTVTKITEDRELSFIDPTKPFMMSTLHKILKTSFLDLTKSEPDPPEDISIKRSIKNKKYSELSFQTKTGCICNHVMAGPFDQLCIDLHVVCHV